MSTTPKLDPIVVSIVCAIFLIMSLVAYTMSSILTVISIVIAALLTFYLISSRKSSDSFRYGRHMPSIFSFSLIILPFIIGVFTFYEGYSFFHSIFLTIMLVGLTITFWNNMLFIPLAIYNSYKENTKEPFVYPRLSIIIPACNEEKVIAHTIESLIEADYPKKEIIVVDDGSTDRTLQVASKYKKYAKILHKENGGKSSALNYGLRFARGAIIVVVDADTIIGRRALKSIVERFSNENIAAVAGNAKVLNKNNWITWCQAVEYMVSIQIIRRGLTVFGTVTVVPGALGAFRREILEQVGFYDKDTLVEDFDQTIKTLKSNLIVQSSHYATAFTEAPETLKDLYKQRMRWYRGNIQAFAKHLDVLTNPRFGFLHRLGFPFMIVTTLLLPTLGIVVWVSAIIAAIQGEVFLIMKIFLLFLTLQHLLTLLAIRLDKEDLRLLLYSTFFVIGYKQIIDMFTIKVALDIATRRRVTWNRVQRRGLNTRLQII